MGTCMLSPPIPMRSRSISTNTKAGQRKLVGFDVALDNSYAIPAHSVVDLIRRRSFFNNPRQQLH